MATQNSVNNTITGNAATATKLQTGHTISTTGDVTYTSPAFDGSGDITAAATIANNAVTTAKINNGAVTLAKIANAAANSKLLGSGAAGSGVAYTELTLGTNLSMSGTTLNATGGSTSVPTVVTLNANKTVTTLNSLYIMVNTAGGPFTLTFPSSPSDGDVFYASLLGPTPANAIALSATHDIEIATGSLITQLNAGDSYQFIYSSGGTAWWALPFYNSLQLGSVTNSDLSANTGFIPTWASTSTAPSDLATSTASIASGVISANGFNAAAGSTSRAPINLTSGTNLTTATAGAIEYDGVNYYATIDSSSKRGCVPSQQYFRLTSTGSTVSTIANYFGSTSNITLVSGGYYEIEIEAWYLKTTTGTVTWTFTNSAAPTSMNISYQFSPLTGVVSTAAATDLFGEQYNITTAAPTIATGAAVGGTNQYNRFKIFLINSTGTSLKIQATCSLGSLTPGIGSRWFCRRLPASSTGTFAA